MTSPLQHLSKNQETVASYEDIAVEYAASTRGTPSGAGEAALRRLVADVPEAGLILELGSGPGWDADFVESLGRRVRRTDAAAAFCDFQAGRGIQVERLDAVLDDYTDDEFDAYDGVMALCLLLHVERADTDRVLAKVAAALRPGGVFLVSVREGVGDEWESGDSGNRYHVTFWQPAAFEERLLANGLQPTWSARSLYGDEAWLTVVAHKSVEAGVTA
jgi:SAM-dependent methyltransferase